MATDTHQYKAKNCIKGIPCGNACISAGKKCKSKLPSNVSASLDAIADPNNLAEGAGSSGNDGGIKVLDKAPESIETLGKGAMGEVYLTENGTAFKSSLYEAVPISADEVDIMNDAAKLGVSPKVEGILKDTKGEIKGLEMEFLAEHRTLLDFSNNGLKTTGIESKGSDFEKRAETIESVSKSVAELHKNGIVHGDLHGNNVMLDKDGGVKMIDYGLSSRIDRKNPSEDQLYEWAQDVSRQQRMVNDTLNGSELKGVSTGRISDLYAKTSTQLDAAKNNNEIKNIYSNFIATLNK
jgi:tRNA A-37 threonylcarbamoyl transferase component Bud32